MGKKTIVKKEVKVEKTSTSEVLVSRKDFLRESIIEHLEDIAPDVERCFNMYHVCELRGTRGSFRGFMGGDFTPADKRILKEILQNLKDEKVLIHVGGPKWARLK